MIACQIFPFFFPPHSGDNREFRSYDGCCDENVTFKKNSVALGLELVDHFMLVKLYKIGEVHFRMLGTNGSHVKAENEKYSATNSRCRQTHK